MEVRLPPTLLSASGIFISQFEKKKIQKHWKLALTETYKAALRPFQTGFGSPIGSGIEIKGKLIILGYFLFFLPILQCDSSLVLKRYITLEL